MKKYNVKVNGTSYEVEIELISETEAKSAPAAAPAPAGNGETVTLTYPNGMISWLSGYESDFDGAAAVDGLL